MSDAFLQAQTRRRQCSRPRRWSPPRPQDRLEIEVFAIKLHIVPLAIPHTLCSLVEGINFQVDSNGGAPAQNPSQLAANGAIIALFLFAPSL